MANEVNDAVTSLERLIEWDRESYALGLETRMKAVSVLRALKGSQAPWPQWSCPCAECRATLTPGVPEAPRCQKHGILLCGWCNPGGVTSAAAPPAIPATWQHDAGAYAQCSFCLRYTRNPKALSHSSFLCDCGSAEGWSGSFKPPGPDARWLAADGVAPSPAPKAPRDVTAMVDAAMVEMSNIHPPLRRSECERLIRAALGLKGTAKSRADMVALLRDPNFRMSGGSEFALEIVAALGVTEDDAVRAWMGGASVGEAKALPTTCPHGTPHRWACEQCDTPGVIPSAEPQGEK